MSKQKKELTKAIEKLGRDIGVTLGAGMKALGPLWDIFKAQDSQLTVLREEKERLKANNSQLRGALGEIVFEGNDLIDGEAFSIGESPSAVYVDRVDEVLEIARAALSDEKGGT